MVAHSWFQVHRAALHWLEPWAVQPKSLLEKPPMTMSECPETRRRLVRCGYLNKCRDSSFHGNGKDKQWDGQPQGLCLWTHLDNGSALKHDLADLSSCLCRGLEDYAQRWALSSNFNPTGWAFRILIGSNQESTKNSGFPRFHGTAGCHAQAGLFQWMAGDHK